MFLLILDSSLNQINPLTKYLDCETVNGKNAGKRHHISKLAITLSDTDIIIAIKLVQFPIRPAYAITIKKSQGASLFKVGIYLNDPIFSHDQLYVAISRVSGVHDLTIATNTIIDRVTRNVNFRKIFEDTIL